MTTDNCLVQPKAKAKKEAAPVPTWSYAADGNLGAVVADDEKALSKVSARTLSSRRGELHDAVRVAGHPKARPGQGATLQGAR